MTDTQEFLKTSYEVLGDNMQLIIKISLHNGGLERRREKQQPLSQDIINQLGRCLFNIN